MHGARTNDRPVHHFMAKRRSLIVLFMKAASATEERHHDHSASLRVRLCESAVDYLSHGYFQLYGHLLSRHTWRDPHAYERFESTSNAVLDFNDGFAAPGHV